MSTKSIAQWMDRLTEYDCKVYHQSCTANIIRIADGMLWMPGRYSQNAVAVDLERMVLATIHPTAKVDGPKATLPENHQSERGNASMPNVWVDPLNDSQSNKDEDTPSNDIGAGTSAQKQNRQRDFWCLWSRGATSRADSLRSGYQNSKHPFIA